MSYIGEYSWEKEEDQRLRGEGDKVKFIDPGFERGQVVGFGKGREGNMLYELHILGILGRMIICGIEFVDWVVKPGEEVGESIWWCF